MIHKQLVTLSDAIHSIHPDWQQTGIVAQLKILSDSWAGTDAAMSVHAMAVAANPQAMTPGAFNAMPPQSIARPVSRGVRCGNCGGTQEQCARLRDKEIRTGVPDPHEFETEADAERNSSHAHRVLNIKALTPGRHLADRTPWLPDDLLTQAEESQEGTQHGDE